MPSLYLCRCAVSGRLCGLYALVGVAGCLGCPSLQAHLRPVCESYAWIDEGAQFVSHPSRVRMVSSMADGVTIRDSIPPLPADDCAAAGWFMIDSGTTPGCLCRCESQAMWTRRDRKRGHQSGSRTGLVAAVEMERGGVGL